MQIDRKKNWKLKTYPFLGRTAIKVTLPCALRLATYRDKKYVMTLTRPIALQSPRAEQASK